MALSHMFSDDFDSGSRICHNISLCGKEFLLDPSGALFWPSERLLIVADLVPRRDESGPKLRRRKAHRLSEKMALLDDVINRTQPLSIVALGEQPPRRQEFVDLGGAALEMFLTHLDRYDWHWVGPVSDYGDLSDIKATAHEALVVNGFTLRHRPYPGPVIREIAGAFSPAAFVRAHGYSIRRPCFVANGHRLVMPSFGQFSGGNNILDECFRPVFANDGLAAWMLGYDGVKPVACRQLRSD